MNQIIRKNLENQEGNYIFPFLWLHGEPEEVLRCYMEAIYNCGIRSVCVESRPHPDFAGPGWWRDMDIILEEARARGMKVWILDDSHFPTGFANGKLRELDPSYRRQNVVCQIFEIQTEQDREITINIQDYLWPVFQKTPLEQFIMESAEEIPSFDDNYFLSITAYSKDGQIISLEKRVTDNILVWEVPAGTWKIAFCVVTRNLGYHRDYINMLDERSCRVLIDAVYEPHYRHYKEDFGKTISGFFSDEPELGNGHLYDQNTWIGVDMDLPWSSEMDGAMKERLGENYAKWIPLLWDKIYFEGRESESEDREWRERTARVRYAYMDAVTRLVEQNFSHQIGEWCREHGVEYIGHLIEDNNMHARTGSSLGHYFRGLAGQDMAGIDDIGGQVIPQGEDVKMKGPLGQERDGEFYHYALGKLGASMAALQPQKKGRAMCEIFGAYGWEEGVHLEKYLAEHFMVRGINRFVPHAFSMKDYPDPDCPPHFYAHGNHPQYRHFGSLMRYMNRVCGLISGGCHEAPVAVLYHGEGEWTGKYMMMQKPGRVLAERQIDFDYIPSDIFGDKIAYGTVIGRELRVNHQTYRALVVPGMEFVSTVFAEAVVKLCAEEFPVIFIDRLPTGLYDGDAEAAKRLVDQMQECCVTGLDTLATVLDQMGIPEIRIEPSDRNIRYYHYINENELFYFVNEAADVYNGSVYVPVKGKCYIYNAWDNCIEYADVEETENGTKISVCLEPSKGMLLVFDDVDERMKKISPMEQEKNCSHEYVLHDGWHRSVCRSIDYPRFISEKQVCLPDQLAEEMPAFSGLVRYERAFIGKEGMIFVLEIADAAEGVEVFVNDVSAGIQVVPIYRYNLSRLIREGENTLRIEVATTLEREIAFAKAEESSSERITDALSGITGEVRVFSDTALQM